MNSEIFKDDFFPSYNTLEEKWQEFITYFPKKEVDLLLQNSIMPWPPKLITIDLLSQCNLDCPFCYNHSGGRLSIFPKKMISKEEIFEFLKSLGNKFDNVSIPGAGEAFLHKDIFEILDYLKETSKGICISTNAMLLNESKINRLLKYPISVFSVSCDAGDNENYAIYRKNGDFDIFKKNFKMIATKFPTITKLMSIVFKQNSDSILRLPKLLNDMEINHIPISLMHLTQHPELNNNSDMQINKLTKKEAEEFLEKMHNECDKYGVSLYYSSAFLDDYKKIESQYTSVCHQPFEYMQVNFLGHVSHCCGGVEMLKSNAYNEKAIKEYNSEMIKKFRVLLAAGYSPKVCQIRCNKKDKKIEDFSKILLRLRSYNLDENLKNIYYLNEEYVLKLKKIFENLDEPIAFFGAGDFLELIFQLFDIDKNKISFIFDDNRKGKINGIEVKPFAYEICTENNIKSIVISSTNYMKEISEKLKMYDLQQYSLMD